MKFTRLRVSPWEHPRRSPALVGDRVQKLHVRKLWAAHYKEKREIRQEWLFAVVLMALLVVATVGVLVGASSITLDPMRRHLASPQE